MKKLSGFAEIAGVYDSQEAFNFYDVHDRSPLIGQTKRVSAVRTKKTGKIFLILFYNESDEMSNGNPNRRRRKKQRSYGSKEIVLKILK
jgi:hypothetical protein